MNHLIIVKPGYYCGFAKMVLGKVDAWMHYGALLQAIERHHGSLSIIDHNYSDELEGEALETIQAALTRSRDAGFEARQVWADDEHEPFDDWAPMFGSFEDNVFYCIKDAVRSIATPGSNADVTILGGIASRRRSKQDVNAARKLLKKRLGYTNVSISPYSLFVEDWEHDW